MGGLWGQLLVNIITACRVQVTDQKEDSKPGKVSHKERKEKRQSSKEEMNDQEAAQ